MTRNLFVCHGNICKLMDFTKRQGDVADPWYTDDFEATWRDVSEGCNAILMKILQRPDENIATSR